MQRSEGRLAGVRAVTFGSTAATRWRVTNSAVLLASLGAAAIDLFGSGTNLIAYYCAVGLVGGPMALVYTQGRAEFTLDFELGLFVHYDNSTNSRSATVSGPLSDISCIRITAIPGTSDELGFSTRIGFRPEL